MTDAANVVRLPEKDPAAPADVGLVRKCVECGAAIAAADASYRIDPDGNNANAVVVVVQYERRVKKLLSKIIKTPARSANGMQAKARLALAIGKSSGEVGLSEQEEKFFYALAADIDEFMEPLIQS
jgi:hypothetical protein